MLGLLATCMGIFILFFLLFTIFSKGFSAFQKSVIELDVTYDQETLNITSNSSYEEQVIQVQDLEHLSRGRHQVQDF